MRITTGLRLLVLCLFVGGLQASFSQAAPHPKAPGATKVIVEEEFPGYGLTLREAQIDARKRACDWLASQSDLGWSPSPDYLSEKGMIEDVGQPIEKEFDVAKDIAKDGKLKVVTIKLKITADQAREIQKQAQDQRMKERQKYSLLGLVGVVALLGVVTGYLRLEEATKGYFTRRLRMVAIGILLVIIAGLFVIA